MWGCFIHIIQDIQDYHSIVDYGQLCSVKRLLKFTASVCLLLLFFSLTVVNSMQTVCCVQSITHAHRNVSMALHNVVSSHITSDITYGHMMNYQSLLIQKGWCKISVCDYQFGMFSRSFRLKLQILSHLEHKWWESLPWGRLESGVLFKKRAGVSE